MQTDLQTIYFDSSILIDLVKFKSGGTFKEVEGDRSADILAADELITASRERKITAITSAITIAECLGIDQDKEVRQEVKDFIDSLIMSGKGGIYLIQPTPSILTLARSLRWDHGVTAKGNDLIHIATACYRGCVELVVRNGKITANKDKIKSLGGGAGPRVILPSASTLIPHQGNLLEVPA